MSTVVDILTAAIDRRGSTVKHGKDLHVFSCAECVADSAALCACLLHALAHARTLLGVVRTYSASGVLIATRTNAEVRRVAEVVKAEEAGGEEDEKEDGEVAA